MKRYKPIYNNQYIEYWPMYETGTAVMGLCVIMQFIAIGVYIWFVITQGWQFYNILLIPLLIWSSFWGGFIWLIRREIREKVVLTSEDVSFINERTKRKNTVCWNEVDAIVYYRQDIHIGPGIGEGYGVFLKGTNRKKSIWKAQYDYFIPVSGVDSKILRLYIPTFLLKNEPEFY